MPGGYRKERGGRKRLTAQKRKEIKEAFDLFDTDGSGKNMLNSCSLNPSISISLIVFLVCMHASGTIDPRELNVAMRCV
jgi:Ca2+-binding EF-hand superfamily protein